MGTEETLKPHATVVLHEEPTAIVSADELLKKERSKEQDAGPPDVTHAEASDRKWSIDGSLLLNREHPSAVAMFGMMVVMVTWPNREWTAKELRAALGLVRPRLGNLSDRFFSGLAKGPYFYRPDAPNSAFVMLEASHLWLSNWEKQNNGEAQSIIQAVRAYAGRPGGEG